MKRQCIKCGCEYSARTFLFDAGCCSECKPGLSSGLRYFEPSPAGTRSVWMLVLGMHIILLPLFALLLDGGTISIPGSIYCLLVILYFTVKFSLVKFTGWPILAPEQVVAVLFLPAYALPIFVALFWLAQRIRYGA